nr:hypothetical protein [Halomonas sp.]
MSNVFLKKVAIAGFSFGLVVSPLAFANTASTHASIKANQDLSVDDEPMQAQSPRSTAQAEYTLEDLMYDEGDRLMVAKPTSASSGAQASYQPQDLIRDSRVRNVQ